MVTDQTSRLSANVFSPLVRFIRYITSTRLVHRSNPLTSAGQIIQWWEYRRIAYNLLVGFTGILVAFFSLACCLFCDCVRGTMNDLGSPFLAVYVTVFYGIMANVCYTGGWVAELLVRAVWNEEKANAFGEISFTIGLVFSICLTCLPAVIVVILSIVRLLSHY